MSSNFKKLMKQNGNGMATISTDQLREELYKRDRTNNPFPLDVFNDHIKPYINALNKYYDIPSSFIGLAMLSAYSTAIGTAYAVTTNGRDKIHLPVWGALVGISSSGKTLALTNIFSPLDNIQNEFDNQWDETTRALPDYQKQDCRLLTVIYRDAHIPTLIKSVLPDNPKGLLKFNDELLEWINGMNQLSKKEGTDEQFWISSWNCMKYSAIRSGKIKTSIPRPFVNVVGGAQYSVLTRMFGKDRDTTGFIFRLLFALTDVDKIAEPDPTFDMPRDLYDRHKISIERLYKNLPVDAFDDEPRLCQLTPQAVKQYQVWVKSKIKLINEIQDLEERDIHSGILGKIKEYTLRFSAILHLADKALSTDNAFDGEFMQHTRFRHREEISSEVMQRALKLADYFFTSAVEVYYKVQTSMTAPSDVLIAATMMKMGKSFADIAEVYYNERSDKTKKSMERLIKKWIREYPKVFNAVAR
jgi:hypothetical protein